MNGDIWLDEAYDSGVPDCPGAKFVVDISAPHVSAVDGMAKIGQDEENVLTDDTSDVKDSTEQTSNSGELPQHLFVLFVDDDLVIRKLFKRCVQRVAPSWKLKEAANGETAIQLVESNNFDVIL